MDPAPGLHAGTGRNADRSRAIGLSECRASSGELVDVRRLHQRVTVTARGVAPVLVGTDEKDVVRHVRDCQSEGVVCRR